MSLSEEIEIIKNIVKNNEENIKKYEKEIKEYETLTSKIQDELWGLFLILFVVIPFVFMSFSFLILLDDYYFLLIDFLLFTIMLFLYFYAKRKEQELNNIRERIRVLRFKKNKLEQEIKEKINFLKSKKYELEQELTKLEHELFELEQKKKGLYKFISITGRVLWGTPKQIKEWIEVELDMKNNFKKLNPYQFEKYIAQLFKAMGYEVKLTSKVADFGADIIAKKEKETIVIQVKKYKIDHKVGAKDVQSLMASIWKYKANKAIFITTSYFTRQAYEQIEGAPVELWDRDKLFDMIEKYILKIAELDKNEFDIKKEEVNNKKAITLADLVRGVGFEPT